MFELSHFRSRFSSKAWNTVSSLQVLHVCNLKNECDRRFILKVVRADKDPLNSSFFRHNKINYDRFKRSLINTIERQKKLLISILKTLKTKDSKKFKCFVKDCNLYYNKLNNFARHIKNSRDAEHRHMTTIINKKYCDECEKMMRRKCDFIRHMRNKHPNMNIKIWNFQTFNKWITNFMSLIISLMTFLKESVTQRLTFNTRMKESSFQRLTMRVFSVCFFHRLNWNLRIFFRRCTILSIPLF